MDGGVIFLICHFVIIHGVRGGIEKASKVMMPLLFILLLIIVVASCLLPDAGKGVEFLLKPDFGKVDRNVFLQCFGTVVLFHEYRYGLYLYLCILFQPTDQSLEIGDCRFLLIDLLVAVLAGLMIFPAAFSVGYHLRIVVLRLSSSPCRMSSIRHLHRLPVLGWIISLMFYVILSVAALTSLMSLHEVNTSFFYEELKIDRKKGATIVTVSCAIIGAFCSLSLGATDKLVVLGKGLVRLVRLRYGTDIPSYGRIPYLFVPGLVCT